MLRGGIPIGRIFGISLRLNYTWFVIFVLVTWALTAGYFPTTYPDWTLATKIVAGVVTSLLFFASIVAHELMHSIVAQKAGITVRSITLFVFGGVSELTEEPKQPRVELWMALAGPLTSLVLGGMFWAIHLWLKDTFEVVAAVTFWLGLINVFLAGFNLIPGFPLDGGRVLRSILWWRNQNLRRATRTASNVGRGIGYLLIFGGIWLVFTGNWFSGLWLALIGWFLENAAVGSYRQVALQDVLQGHTVNEVMTRDCPAVPPELTIEKLVHEHILTSGRRCFPVLQNERLLGLATLDNIKTIPRERWTTTVVKEIMTPFEKLKWVKPSDDLSTILPLMTQDGVNQLPVAENGRMVGLVARDSLISFISLRGELGM